MGGGGGRERIMEGRWEGENNGGGGGGWEGTMVGEGR